ncbi:MAG: gamma-glutamyltransferase family protein [Pyramidobacter sp.]
MKLKKFVLALGVMAACASGALAADAPKKGNTMGGLLVEDTKVANQYVWAPSSGAPMCRTPFTTRFPARGRYVVIGDNQYSAAAGFKILDRGGNAFDAAVGMAAVMGMTYPSMNDLFGGDAMIIVYSAKDKKVITYNGSGWAPKKATIDAYIEKGGIPEEGILSVEVPGSFSGWMTLLKDYGSMKLSDIFEPAIDLAENGHSFSQIQASLGKNFYRFMNDEAKKVYGRDGALAKYNDIIRNPDYAKLLREVGAMSYQEAEDFVYRGKLAHEIADFSKSLGGFIEYEDLADFHAEKVEAHSTNFHGIDVYVCPPNSQGWTLLEALNLLEPLDLKSMGYNSAAYIDALTQALNLALQDRNHNMADERFHKNPVSMIQKKYAADRAKDMHLGKAMTGDLSTGKPDDPEKYGDVYYGRQGDTTFMAVADAEGNIVACTTSQCGAFGSCLMVPGRGFILNNRMPYFFLDDSLANFLEPRKRTIQTITPSIALKDGKPYLAFGTPGADVQEQAKLQVFLNVALWGMNPQEAVEAPRFQSRHPMGIKSHASYPATIQVEGRVPQAVRDELKDKYGYTVQSKFDWEYIGLVGAIAFDNENGRKSAGSDPRADAIAYGW